jgi:hypothetical protein
MITVDGKVRNFDDVKNKKVRERLLNALGDVLAEEGVDVEQVRINSVDYQSGRGGNFTIEVNRK